MKKGSVILIAVLAVVAVIVIALVGGYNSMVDAQTDVEQKQADIQTQLQRRADLIPNFVATVKGYSDYEQSTLQAVTEAYPDLKANQNYIALQDELAGTENRIAVARQDYNESAKEYNAMIRRFPKSLLAGMFGFEKVSYFEASAGAEEVPTVSFG